MVRFLDRLGLWPFLVGASICLVLGYEKVPPNRIGWYMAAGAVLAAGTLGVAVGSAGAI